MFKRFGTHSLAGLFLVLTLVFGHTALKHAPLAEAGYVPGDAIPTIEVETNVPNPFHTLVSTEFVKSIVSENLVLQEQRQDVMIIDARPKRPRYDRGHIPTAVSLPDSEFMDRAHEVLPEDKSTLLIFYCMNPG